MWKFSWIRRLLIALALSGMAAGQTNCELGAKRLQNIQPQGITTEQIIQRAAANEAIFKSARTHYAYGQEIEVETLRRGVLPTDLYPDGEFRQVSEVRYDSSGRRIENVTYAPQSTLRSIAMTKDDFDDILERTAFVLLPEVLPQYQVHYLGQQRVDELDTYVFEVSPVTLHKDRRYFQGRVWIENRDLAIVKSCGKTVPDQVLPAKKKRGTENLHPTFVSYRDLIDHQYWLPVYARSDDLLLFRFGPVRIRETVKFTDYHNPDAKPAHTPASSLEKTAR